MEHVQDSHRQSEHDDEDGATGEGPAPPDPAGQLLLGPALGPPLGRHRGRVTTGPSGSSVTLAGKALICPQSTDPGDLCNG